MNAGHAGVRSARFHLSGHNTHFEHSSMGRARRNKAEKVIEHKVYFHAWDMNCDFGCISVHINKLFNAELCMLQWHRTLLQANWRRARDLYLFPVPQPQRHPLQARSLMKRPFRALNLAQAVRIDTIATCSSLIIPSHWQSESCTDSVALEKKAKAKAPREAQSSET